MPSPNEANYIQLLVQLLELSSSCQFGMFVRFAASQTTHLPVPK